MCGSITHFYTEFQVGITVSDCSLSRCCAVATDSITLVRIVEFSDRLLVDTVLHVGDTSSGTTTSILSWALVWFVFTVRCTEYRLLGNYEEEHILLRHLQPSATHHLARASTTGVFDQCTKGILNSR